MKIGLLSILTLLTLRLTAQTTGLISGKLLDIQSQQPVSSATIRIIGLDTLLAQPTPQGTFSIVVPTGKYNIECTALGFVPFYSYNINVNAGNPQFLTIELSPSSQLLEEVAVKIRPTVRATDRITLLSTQKLTSEEIRANPGGNFDVSKVIQVLPGVSGGTSANRNDIIVRGGGPGENVYYLDGIEIPVLNHFQTQGASGGATGILNVSFIDDVQLSSSAFDSKYDNALASTFVIKQRNGNPDRLAGNVRLSGSEFATTFEGPLGPKTTFLASARRSYLQFLFKLLDLPIRPDYWDFQYKVNHKIDSKSELTLIGLGAIDNFKLEPPKSVDVNKEYILRSNPLIKQWNYTMGASFKRLVDQGYYTLALSRNMSFNGADRYANNAVPEGNKLFSLQSHESENKLRLDVNKYNDGWKWSYGLGAQYSKYDVDLFNTVKAETSDGQGKVSSPAVTVNTRSAIDFFKLGGYIHLSKYLWEERVLLSAGARTDMNTFTSGGRNPLKSLSPRVSMSYVLSPEWNISGSIGSYYKLPIYTALGYRDINEQLVNKDLKYINSVHYTLGTQFVPRNDFRFTVEAFYKRYNNYPVSRTDGISLANVGTDFSAVGNDSYTSQGEGKVYGAEAYVQQKLIRNLFYIASATLFKSVFSGSDGVFKPSTWDYGYTISATLGYKFKKNLDVGIKYRAAGGQPYTPFDPVASRAQYLTLGRGVLDYTQLNSERLSVFQQLDIRVDKKFNFRQTSLIVFADLQNALLFKTPSLPKYTFERNADNSNFLTTDGKPVSSDGANAVPLILNDRNTTAVPSIGFIFEF
ncbi:MULTISPECIES: TonB-dependent receptor domain-containing protein [Sphingobacterium]|uniref:TonB-dependent receptor n=1 Tax=Sphingobacterium TaxID=28453 RepID=UPI0013DCDFC7|nr:MULTISPECIES: TonB-dependent receptor [unclassified Sphingobacterium]